ncbi:DUF4183 domain-containing protein [Psychrobacillus sp. AK 1817]|uniref:DUF4183 domain-containing protein n=1 Tax=Psychrobacillus faecigallinarum TaxID=2762235 RepID=A0ABR8R8Z3_9BACI|nr:DUF4183 domain-containing protein [Psychrobacillus faecigallinarum]QEY21054.1 DUF4183 domain-containing protein [Psychrobacillus sp. AK 1817]
MLLKKFKGGKYLSLKIIKLAIGPKQSVSASPMVTRLFHEVPEIITDVSTHKIDTSMFLDDRGEVAQNLPLLNLNNSYFNVYINGVLQMDDNFAYTAGEDGVGSLLISLPEDAEIPKGTPIIMEIINFAPEINTPE